MNNKVLLALTSLCMVASITGCESRPDQTLHFTVVTPKAPQLPSTSTTTLEGPVTGADEKLISDILASRDHAASGYRKIMSAVPKNKKDKMNVSTISETVFHEVLTAQTDKTLIRTDVCTNKSLRTIQSQFVSQLDNYISAIEQLGDGTKTGDSLVVLNGISGVTNAEAEMTALAYSLKRG